MKKIILISLLLIGAVVAQGQYNSLGLYNPHFTFNKAELLPSKLGTSQSKLEFRILPNAYIYAGNSFMAIDHILYPSSKKIDAAIYTVDGDVIFGSNLEIPGLAVSYKFGKIKELFTMSLSNKTRVLANTSLNENFLKLLWNGNKQFEGETIDLGNFGFNALAATEVNLGAAIPFSIGEKLDLRAGITLKYILGMAGASLKETSSTLETGEDGKYINLDNLNYRASFSDTDGESLFSGKGFGFDLGATVIVKEKNVSASVAVLDIGSVSFSGNTKTYLGSGNFSFEGVIIDNVFNIDNVQPDSVFVDGLKGDSIVGESFSVSLPTRLVIQVEKNIMSKDGKNGKEYIKHGIYLTYIQGLKNAAGSTTKPYFSVGYSRSFKNILNVGPTMNYGGYSGFGLGMFLSVKAGPFKIGAGTNTGLSYLLEPDAARGVDFSFMTTWSIGKKKVKSAASMN